MVGESERASSAGLCGRDFVVRIPLHKFFAYSLHRSYGSKRMGCGEGIWQGVGSVGCPAGDVGSGHDETRHDGYVFPVRVAAGLARETRHMPRQYIPLVPSLVAQRYLCRHFGNILYGATTNT